MRSGGPSPDRATSTSSPCTGGGSLRGPWGTGCPRRPREKSSPRSTATTCSRSPTPTPSPSPHTRPRGSSATVPWSSSPRLMNNQPMGFYPLETLKQDARRFGVPFRNPCVNRTRVRCIPEDGVRAAGSSASSGTLGAESARSSSWRKVRSVMAPTPARETWCGARGSSRRQCCPWCNGRGLRRSHPQPQGGAVGRRPLHPPLAERAAGLPRIDAGRRPGPRRLHSLRADGGRVPGHGRLPSGAPHGVRAANAEPPRAANRRRGGSR